ncbi:MAG: hypothetical protein GF408_03105 [Candidatus Omnitrophica bacterium]|nr:hypothetical protein [Candidatus Omnitrophota bacterium]
MKCDICGIREASVHLTEVINGRTAKMHICDRCAKEKSEEMQSHFGLTDLLSGLMDMSPSGASGRMDAGESRKCPVCGMNYFDFQKTGRLGCGKCYEEFAGELSELLKKIHGSDRHVGKAPYGAACPESEQEDLKKLKKELDKLVREEQYEKAALLRDRIKEIEDGFNGEEKK